MGYSPFKEWLLRKLEPYREERASEMLAWRIFAQKHNAAGKMPQCAWQGMDEKGYELNPKGKVVMYEFPPGAPQAEPYDPDCLVKAHQQGDKKKRDKAINAALDEARRS